MALGVILVSLTLLWSRGLEEASRPSPQEALLSRQNQELIELTKAAEEGKLLDFKGMLIVVDQSLVQDLLRAVTPMDADVGSGFHVRVDSVDAVFGDGVALIQLSGAASVNSSQIGVPVTVLGAIDQVVIDKASGVLRCGISILGVEARDAKALGRNDPIGRLSEALAEGGISLLLGPLEIPVRIEDRLEIPAVTSKRLQIARDDLPLIVNAQRLKVFNRKLWIFVDADVAPARKTKEVQG